MRLENWLTIVVIGILAYSMPVRAELGLAISSGRGIHDIVPYRFSVSWDFGAFWKPPVGWGLHAVWENSAAYWDGPARPDLACNRPTDLKVLTTGPMLKWQRNHPYTAIAITPYIEIGVGLSWLSETEIQGRMLSLHFQFEDKIGVGLKLGQKQQYDVSVRAYHYSNASIKRPNSGVNLAMVSFGVWFPKTI